MAHDDCPSTSTPEETWIAIYREHAGTVYRYLVVACGNEEDAKDLRQEVFIKLWKVLSTEWPIDNPKHWLMRLARRAAIDLRMQRARDADAYAALARLSPVFDDTSESVRADPPRRSAVQAPARSLSAVERTVVEGRIRDKKTLRVLATELHLSSPQAVHRIWTRAIQKIRRLLGG